MNICSAVFIFLTGSFVQSSVTYPMHQELRIPYSLSATNKITCNFIEAPGDLHQLTIKVNNDTYNDNIIRMNPVCAYVEGSCSDMGVQCILFCREMELHHLRRCSRITTITPDQSSSLLMGPVKSEAKCDFNEIRVCVFQDPMTSVAEISLSGYITLQYTTQIIEESPVLDILPPLFSGYSRPASSDMSGWEPQEYGAASAHISSDLAPQAGPLIVQVDNSTDSAAIASNCNSATHGLCNLRSAVAYCLSTGAMTASNRCTVNLPAADSIHMDLSLGYIVVNDAAGHVNLWIEGNGSRVRSQSAGIAGLFNFTSILNRFDVQVTNMTIEKFGLHDIDSMGAVYIKGVNNALFDGVIFQHNAAARGGAVYMLYADDVSFSNCTFYNSTSSGGGAISIRYSDRTHFSNCQFLSCYSYNSGGAVTLLFSHGLFVSNCLFDGHRSRFGGSAIYGDSDIHNATFERTVFSNNAANIYDGGTVSFSITCSNISFLDCQFIDNSSIKASAVYFWNFMSDIFFINCIFIGNAASSGGAIHFLDTIDLVVIDNCSFINNTGYNGAGIYIYSEITSMSIRESTFLGNSVTQFGGGIYSDSGSDGLIIADCIFKHNYASSSGGAIYMKENFDYVTITNCLFQFNSAHNDGGAVYLREDSEYFTFKLCNFTENFADLNGGAVNAYVGIEHLVLDRCRFVNNVAARYNGGAFYSNGRLDYAHIRMCVFEGNFALLSGGALYCYSFCDYVTFYQSVFRSNYAGVSGGAVTLYRDSQYFNITECIFSHNEALSYGGALNLYSIHVDSFVHLTKFLHNSATSGNGGAVYVGTTNERLTILEALFINNTAGENGGAMTVENVNTDTTVDRCRFADNKAAYLGGGVWIDFENDRFAFRNCEAVRNTAGEDGGFLYVATGNDDIYVYNSQFYHNTANLDGGVVYVKDDNYLFRMELSVLRNNTAVGNAGGIVFRTANYGATIAHSIFSDHTAGGTGGTLYLAFDNSFLEISNTTIHTSTCGMYGGGLFFGSNHEVVLISDSRIENCRAAQGGAIYISLFSERFAIQDTHIAGNWASENGGGIAVHGSETVFNGSTISDNSGNHGGGVYITGEKVEILNCEIRSNVAWADGGGIKFDGVSDFQLSTTLVQSNKADNGGGLAMSSCETVYVFDCRFLDNQASAAGGAWYDVFTKEVSISQSVLAGNGAYNGGAMFSFRGGDIIVDLCNISSNNATLSGGATDLVQCTNCSFFGNWYFSNTATRGSGSVIMAVTSSLSISHCSFLVNNALSGGGAVTWRYGNGMAEPTGLRSLDNVFADNRALYGPNWATDGMQISSNSSVYTVSDFTVPIPVITVRMEDYYGQTVRSDSITALQVYVLPQYTQSASACYDAVGYASGGLVATLESGVAEFSTLEVYCAPGYNISLNISTYTSSNVNVEDRITVRIRSCERGEYYHDKVCSECESGTFSFEDNSDLSVTFCQKCPDHSKGCWGAQIDVDEGYWRISPSATTIQECPYGTSSCIGGVGSGDALCGDGYEGPLCAVCSDGFYLDAVTFTCVRCRDSSWADPFTMVMLITMVLFGVCIACITNYVRRKRSENQTIGSIIVAFLIRHNYLDTEATEKGFAFVIQRVAARMKVYVTFYQIISMLPFVLDMQFSRSYVGLLAVLDVLNFDFTRHSSFSCSRDTLDFVDMLVIRTGLPIVVVAMIWLVQFVHIRWRPRDSDAVEIIRATYFKLFLLISILLLPGISTSVFETFSCHDVDPDNSSAGPDLYLRADYRVSCSSDRYEFALVWAICSVFVYPIGLPVYYLHVLYSAKDDIMSRHHPAESAKATAKRDTILRPLKPLYNAYKPHLWFFELVDIMHRLFLTGFLTLIDQGSVTQVLVGFLMIVFFKKLYEYLQPYDDAVVGQVKDIAMWQIYVIMLIALLIRLDYVKYDHPTIALMLTLALIGNVILEVALIVARWVYVSMTRTFAVRGKAIVEMVSANPIAAISGAGHESVHIASPKSRYGDGYCDAEGDKSVSTESFSPDRTVQQETSDDLNLSEV